MGTNLLPSNNNPQDICTGYEFTRPTTSKAMAACWGREVPNDLLDWLQVPTRHVVSGGDPALDGLVLLDLPDHDSTERAHRDEVDRLVQLVDMFIWVVDPQKYADAALHDIPAADIPTLPPTPSPAPMPNFPITDIPGANSGGPTNGV